MSAKERFRYDPLFNQFVCAVDQAISNLQLTPREAREAVMLAYDRIERRKQLKHPKQNTWMNMGLTPGNIRPDPPPPMGSVRAMSQEEHEAIHRTSQGGTISPERLTEMIITTGAYEKFPCGLRLSEIRAQDIETALQELAEYRQSELRPAVKFLTNTLEQQLQHIEQEFNEVKEALHKYRINPMPKEWDNITEELTDLKTSCETMLAIMGMDAAGRRAEVRKVNAKNERRKYFDRTE